MATNLEIKAKKKKPMPPIKKAKGPVKSIKKPTKEKLKVQVKKQEEDPAEETNLGYESTRKSQLPKILGFSLGAEILKTKFPKAFGFAEKVVTEWVSDGNFNELPIEAPIVQFYVGEGLRRAKSVEKKIESRLDDAGVLPVVRHQLDRARKFINNKK